MAAGKCSRETNQSNRHEDTRPYRFGEFDILAVSMHPSSKNWSRFLFAVGDSLLSRPENEKLIKIMQPVPKAPNERWTDQLLTCIEWLYKHDTKAGRKNRRPMGKPSKVEVTAGRRALTVAVAKRQGRRRASRDVSTMRSARQAVHRAGAAERATAQRVLSECQEFESAREQRH